MDVVSGLRFVLALLVVLGLIAALAWILRRPQTVSKGNTVTMVYETRGMSLSAIGVAENSGTHGDMIRVRNRQTDLVVDARITGAGRVAVLVLPQLAANQTGTEGATR